jgi:hypothetical protein
MAFWTDATGNDPKRQFRFLVILGNFPNGATWYAKKTGKPSFTVTEIDHSYLNHTFYYPGRVKWNDLSVTLVDPVSPDAVANTLSMVQASGYRLPTSMATTPEETSTISKAKSVNALGGVVIQQIDSNGSIIEQWTLNGAFLTEVNFGELDYSSDEIVEVTLKFRYDWADCVTANNAEHPIGPENDFFKLGSPVVGL